MIAGLLDHLWQSTLFAGATALLVLCLRGNPARLRFRLWFAASLKFLLPFAALSALGESLSRLFPATVPRLMLEIGPAAEGLSAPAQVMAAHQHGVGLNWMPLLGGMWFAGFLVVLGLRLVRWFRLRAVMRRAHDADIAMPVDVKVSRTLLEPGLVGILKPVVLLPEGLMPCLTRAERDAILAHELSHFSSGDNATSAIHMLVEALFWFWPLVWLIGARLIAERERACDESVLAEGHDAEVYAQGILKVCRFCIRSPLACASGASGADLAKRLRQVMAGEKVCDPGPARKAMLATALVLALGLPVAAGFVSAPPLVMDIQARVAAAKFQVVARIGQAAAPVQHVKARRRLARLKIAPSARSPQDRQLAAAEMPAATPEIPADPAPATAVVAKASALPDTTAAPARAAVREMLVALYPQGAGDPDGVTCRAPEALPGSRLPGPRVCETNRQWASLRARHEDITPDGESIILPNGGEMHAGYAVLTCSMQRITGTGPGVSNAVLSVATKVCF